MEKKLSKNLRIIVLRGDINIPIEEARSKLLIREMESRKFINIDGRIINTVDIIGIFLASDLESVIRRKNGQWQDDKGGWRNKGEYACRCGNIISWGKKCGICN